jgi:hypothetical protein
MNADMWKIGCSGTPVHANGITACEWLCTIAMTSGRFL